VDVQNLDFEVREKLQEERRVRRIKLGHYAVVEDGERPPRW
jgi:hypothetical protein